MKRLIFLSPIVLFSLFMLSFSFKTSTVNAYSGFLRAINVRYYSDTFQVKSLYQGIGFLTKGTQITIAPLLCQKNGKLWFNNHLMSYQPVVRAYYDTVHTDTNLGINWALSNSDSLQPFNINSNLGYPIVPRNILIPNKISKSTDLLLNLNGVSNVDDVEFDINDGGFNINFPYYNKCNFSPLLTIYKSKFCTLNVSNSNLQLRITFIKYEDVTVSEKIIRLENRVLIIKPIIATL
ncbi:MAG: hypothetical protein JSU07_03225 [Bacteroidetes bacterium]|nr:hypothetical protein [Bacteroidota bacterium]